MRRTVRLLATAATTALLSAPVAQAATKEPTATGRGGAAATVDTLATKAAIDTLRKGGNAVDAAVTAAGVLGVVEPFSCGIGGGGFMLIRDGRTGRITTLDHREKSPAAMTPTSFTENGAPLAFDPARYSGLSAGVPGTPLGWERALKRYGTITLARALKPGARIARRGFRADELFVAQIASNGTYFADVPSTAELFLDDQGNPVAVGAKLRNPDLAALYDRVGKLGARRGFYTGRVARAIARASQRPPVAEDATHVWRPGLMTVDDLSDYAAPWRAPTRISYRGLRVFGMGPPSSGGTTVGEALNILEGYTDLRSDRALALHRYLEASRLTYADRNAYLADPRFFDVPLRGLLSDSFAAERRALIGDTAAMSPVAPGDPTGNGGAGQASATISRPNQSTTHLSVADRNGNVVSYTFTIESIGGNGIVVPGYGFLLNNELTDFNYDSTTHPNRSDGGKRPRSSMAPTIITRNGKPYLALGSPGGSTIPTSVLQVLLNRLDLGMTLPQAIAAPRASQRNTATTQAEQAFIDSPEGQALLARGHAFATPPAPGEIGVVAAIEHRAGGRLLAATEPTRRGGGSAMVVRKP